MDDFNKQKFRDQARIVLETIYEPSKEMLAIFDDPKSTLNIWQNMISKALER